jgi:hypothetical protein
MSLDVPETEPGRRNNVRARGLLFLRDIEISRDRIDVVQEELRVDV